MATASTVTRNRNTESMNRIPAASEKKGSGDKTFSSREDNEVSPDGPNDFLPQFYLGNSGTMGWCRANGSTPPRVLDVLNSTAFEIGHWAGISESLIPLVNTFQLATTPLNRQRMDIQLNRVGFLNKTLLVGSLQQYSRGVYAGGQSMYNVTLATKPLG
ncbi:hypothetical protein LTS15_006413 [Exophiala xenobiotica]|nr:hypothetical protein LTS15_006413 [Exophiala xenobiotica]